MGCDPLPWSSPTFGHQHCGPLCPTAPLCPCRWRPAALQSTRTAPLTKLQTLLHGHLWSLRSRTNKSMSEIGMLILFLWSRWILCGSVSRKWASVVLKLQPSSMHFSMSCNVIERKRLVFFRTHYPLYILRLVIGFYSRRILLVPIFEQFSWQRQFCEKAFLQIWLT